MDPGPEEFLTRVADAASLAGDVQPLGTTEGEDGLTESWRFGYSHTEYTVRYCSQRKVVKVREQHPAPGHGDSGQGDPPIVVEQTYALEDAGSFLETIRSHARA